MLQPTSAANVSPSRAMASRTATETQGPERPTAVIAETHPVFGDLPSTSGWGADVVKRYYAGSTEGMAGEVRCADAELALFFQRLNAWRADPAAGVSRVTDQQVVEDLQSALIAAVSIGIAHSAEMVLIAFSSHPLVRIAAVSHPYVLATFLESMLKRLAGVQDPDPENLTGVRYQEKITAALINWNAVQPALDSVVKTPLAKSLKVVATAVISAVRDLAERANTMALLQDLPANTPPGPTKLTAGETLFINCLMCWLRNVGVDLIRHVVRSGGDAGAPIVVPATKGVIERLVQPLFLGSQVPGALPAAAIAAQPAFGDAMHHADQAGKQKNRMDEILEQSHRLF